MCQTGGPRCYTHAKPVTDRAEAAYRTAVEHSQAAQAAWEDADDDRWENGSIQAVREAERQESAAYNKFRDALGDLAATEAGVEEITARTQPRAENPLGHEFPVHQILDDGKFRRKRGEIARKIRAANNDVSGVVGMTGDREVDGFVVEAARNLAADPAAHNSTPPRLPNVARYATQDAKDAGVIRWRTGVKRVAAEYKREKGRLREADQDVRILEQAAEHPEADESIPQRLADARQNAVWARNAFNNKGAELVLMAEKYRIAKRREVSDEPRGEASARTWNAQDRPTPGSTT